MSADRPMFTDEQLHAALAALGLRQIRSVDPARSIDHALLLGALLALAEMAVRDDLAPGTDGQLRTGYRWALDNLAGNDAPTSARIWALLVQHRLNRTADELHTGVDERGQALVNVAAPAALAAANVLSLLHHTAPAPGLVAGAIATADANLAAASRALDLLRAGLRRDGFNL